MSEAELMPVKEEKKTMPKLRELSIGEIPIYYGGHPQMPLMIMEKSISGGAFSDEEKQVAQRALVYSIAGDSIPAKYRNKPMDIFVVLMQGRQLGLSDMQALTNITLINGNPCLCGNARLALIMASKLCTYYKATYFDEKFKEISLENGNLDSEVYGVQVHMKKGDLEHKETFTKRDAEKGGLFNKQGFAWKNWTKDMMKHRAGHRVEDILFPDILQGIGSAEAESDAIAIKSEPSKINLNNVENFE